MRICDYCNKEIDEGYLADDYYISLQIKIMLIIRMEINLIIMSITQNGVQEVKINNMHLIPDL